MAVMNYTTEVPVDRTLAEVEKILVKHGASAILREYDGEFVTRVSFKVKTQHGEVPFSLPANVDGVYKILISKKRDQHNARVRNNTWNQAHRVTWRVIKDWIEAQMALVQIELATLDQVFLPYAQLTSGGSVKTVYQIFTEKGGNLLGHDQ